MYRKCWNMSSCAKGRFEIRKSSWIISPAVKLSGWSWKSQPYFFSHDMPEAVSTHTMLSGLLNMLFRERNINLAIVCLRSRWGKFWLLPSNYLKLKLEDHLNRYYLV